MSRIVLTTLGAIVTVAASASPAWAAQPAPPLPEPSVFQPGVISGPANDGSPVFAADGASLYFTRGGVSWSSILVSRNAGGRWSRPQLAPFSGAWSDLQPAMAPDGSYMIFVSRRPATAGAKPHIALWRVERKGPGWSAPARLADPVNAQAHFRPAIAANGDLYLMCADPGAAPGRFRLCRARHLGDSYAAPEPLAFSDGAASDVDPYVAPDGAYLLFSSAGRRGPADSAEHLYVAFAQGDGWSAPRPLHYGQDALGGEDNEATVSRDGRTLYFSSTRSRPFAMPRTRAQATEDLDRAEAWDNGNTNVWSVPLAPLLAAARAEVPA